MTTAGAVTFPTTGEAVASGSVAMIGSMIRASSSALGDNDNVNEELEVIMGHPGLGAPG
jgi:hypothetical protein